MAGNITALWNCAGWHSYHFISAPTGRGSQLHGNLRPLARWNKDVVLQNVSGCGVEFIQEHEMGTWGSAQALLEDIRERHLAGDSWGAENSGTDGSGKWGPCSLHMSQMV